jgi:hypothetical protein
LKTPTIGLALLGYVFVLILGLFLLPRGTPEMAYVLVPILGAVAGGFAGEALRRRSRP